VSSKYRPKTARRKLIALSISYERDNLLRRGMGIEHLRELLLGLARPLIQGSANVAYAGHWRETDDNFTYDLLQLINDEREEQNIAASKPSAAPPVGWLYNHLAWPNYLTVTPETEARWAHGCRIIRVTQQLAGIPAASRVPDSLPVPDSEGATFNSAIVLSAMRKLATEGMTLEIAGIPKDERPKVPRLDARILLGGKLTGYSGFLPGLFEEALLAMEDSIPLYILGGFGGSAGALSEALLAPKRTRTPELSFEWHAQHTPQVKQLETLAGQKSLPDGVRSGSRALGDLYKRIDAARGPSLASALNTGLDRTETEELMTTIDIRRALYLCLKAIVPDAV
jgi:SLOG cluster2